MAQSNVWTGLKRGVLGQCPNCGVGKLFRSYLKVDPICAACGHDNAQYPSDDAPPYFTILIVGHVLVAPVLCFSFILTWPVGLVLALTLPSIMALTLLLLPRVKGAVIGVQWAIKRNDGEVPGADQHPAWLPQDVAG
jgi:uncharacterized protein (DUF983 family)